MTGTGVLAVDLSQGVEDAFGNVIEFFPKLVGFLLILIVGYFVAKAVSKIADKALERVGFDKAVERGGIKKRCRSRSTTLPASSAKSSSTPCS